MTSGKKRPRGRKLRKNKGRSGPLSRNPLMLHLSVKLPTKTAITLFMRVKGMEKSDRTRARSKIFKRALSQKPSGSQSSPGKNTNRMFRLTRSTLNWKYGRCSLSWTLARTFRSRKTTFLTYNKRLSKEGPLSPKLLSDLSTPSNRLLK